MQPAATDLLYGDGSHDIISAGSGNDVLHGGAGRDWLVGGSGSDRLMGGSGGDRFDFAGGKDVIVDFADDQDIIGVDDYALHTPVRYWEDLVARTRVVHGDLVINFGHGDVLTILGITDVESLRNDMGFV